MFAVPDGLQFGRKAAAHWLILLWILLTTGAWHVQAQTDYIELGKTATNTADQIFYFSKAIEQNPQHVEAYYLRGWSYKTELKLNKALQDFKKCFELISPTNAAGRAQVLSAWAEVLYRLARYDECIVKAGEAISLKADLPFSWRIRGLAHHQIKAYDKAIADFTAFLKLGAHAYAYYDRAWSYEGLNKLPEALADVEQALKLEPGNRSYQEYKITLLGKLGRLQEAQKIIETFVQIQDNDPLSLVRIGEVYLRNNQPTIALNYFNQAKELYITKQKQDPQYQLSHIDELYQIYQATGDVYRTQQDFSNALGNYAKAAELKPREFSIWYRIGEVQCTQARNYREAAAAYEKCFNLNPTYPEGWVNWGFSYGQMDERAKSVEVYKRALKVPDVQSKGLILNNLGYTYLEMKQYDLARETLLEAVRTPNTPVMSFISLGEFWLDRNEIDKAIDQFNQAEEYDYREPNENLTLYYKRALAYITKHAKEPNAELPRKAIADAQKALAIDANHIESLVTAGRAYYLAGMDCPAYKHLKKALELDSKNVNPRMPSCITHLNQVTTRTPNPCK